MYVQPLYGEGKALKTGTQYDDNMMKPNLWMQHILRRDSFNNHHQQS